MRQTTRGLSSSLHYTYLVWISFLILLMGHCPSGLAKQPLRIAYPDFAPFHYIDKQGKLQGFFYEIITEAVENRLGVPIVWNSYPWIRCQENVRNGIDDALLTVPTAQRAEYTQTHARPLWSKELHIFTSAYHLHLQEIMQVKNLNDLEHGKFSVITYSGNGWHQNNIIPRGILSYETSDLKSVWHMLAAQHGDIVIEWPHAANLAIQAQANVGQIIDTGITIDKMPFKLLMRTGSPYIDILKSFDKVIDDMRRDGTMDNILKKLN